jgi:hypothetical protein
MGILACLLYPKAKWPEFPRASINSNNIDVDDAPLKSILEGHDETNISPIEDSTSSQRSYGEILSASTPLEISDEEETSPSFGM